MILYQEKIEKKPHAKHLKVVYNDSIKKKKGESQPIAARIRQHLSWHFGVTIKKNEGLRVKQQAMKLHLTS